MFPTSFFRFSSGFRCLFIAFCVAAVCAIPGKIPPSWATDSSSWTLTARPWPEASALFRSDPHWLGGDGASSVALGKERILWLFGDSFVNPGTSGSRRDAGIVRNSLALQEGTNPALSRLSFFWNSQSEPPGSFFKEQGTRWFWPGCGIRIGDRLLLFLMEVEKSENSLGFDLAGWRAALITNPDKKPACWQLRWLAAPSVYSDIIIGSGSALVEGLFLYTFGVDRHTHKVYLLRWPLSAIRQGDLSAPQWRIKNTWREQHPADPLPTAIFRTGAMEFTVHYDRKIHRYLETETGAPDNSTLFVRSAPTLAGPWSEGRTLYRPPEAGDTGLMIYAGKAHPELSGATLVFTYVANAKNFSRLLTDRDIYYPIMLKGEIARPPDTLN